jgi:hypothetical protein
MVCVPSGLFAGCDCHTPNPEKVSMGLLIYVAMGTRSYQKIISKENRLLYYQKQLKITIIRLVCLSVF